MAGVRSKAAAIAVGSSEWIHQERQQLSQFYGQEQEDFVFSVRNDTEWLNEHMAEIFSNKKLDVKEIFKTPGKLRGKTPRTVRGKSPERAPLTEIFSADKRYNQSPSRVQSSAKGSRLKSPLADSKPIDEQFPPIIRTAKPPHDSGYHGSFDDMDIDQAEETSNSVPEKQIEEIDVGLLHERRDSAEERTTAERSFHSAKEEATTRDEDMEDVQRTEAPVVESIPGAFPHEPSLPPTHKPKTATIGDQPTTQPEETQSVEQQQRSRSSSVGSSPAKPLLRKSSLTFAALPAREPLGTKKSIGNQATGVSTSEMSMGQMNRPSYLGRYTGGKSLGGVKNMEEDKMDIDNAEEREPTTQIHNKDSTQRLHDRINLLSKTQPSRSTKSVTTVISNQPTYPQLAVDSAQQEALDKREKKDGKTVKIIENRPAADDAGDDWTMPKMSRADTAQYPTLTKSRSVDVMESLVGKESVSGIDLGLEPGEREIFKTQSPLKYHPAHGYDSPAKVYAKAASTVDLSTTNIQPIEYQKPISVSNPEFPPKVTSTTPAGSPTGSKFHLDGHLSASKHKLQSIMKTARGLFSSSARVSNQAKMETMSPSNMKMQKAVAQSGLGDINELPVFDQPAYPKIAENEISKGESPSKGRKTRSSTEREKELKRQEKAAKDLEKQEAELAKAREQERIKAAKFQEKLRAAPSTTSLVSKSSLEQTSRPIRSSPRRLPAMDKPLPPINSKIEAIAASSRPQSQLGQASKTLQPPRRPVRPVAKDNTFPKTKQPPVNIRIGPLSGRTPLAGSILAAAQEECAPPVPAKQMVTVKKPSTASIQTNASTASLKSSVSSNTSRARAPITRKIERKPTAQEEAQKRIAERTAATEEAKKLAYKQAMDKKILPGREQPQSSARPVQPSKGTLAQSQRSDLGATKPLAKSNGLSEFPRPPTALSTKGKRLLDEADHELPPPLRSADGPNYKLEDAKRRRTGEKEAVEQAVVRPVEVPPMRYSNIRKDPLKSSIFGGNYPTAPPPAAIHASISRPLPQQAQMAPPNAQPIRVGPVDMAKFADGRIPFANQPNPPQQAPFKTPLHKQSNTLQPPSTFSPMLPNPENIHLDEIETSEEDEDSEDERQRKNNLPDWTRTPNMNAILLQQETIDTDAVFGTIAPANLEEWFPKDKNRLHKLRARTSSANWFGADRLTEEEVKRDLEARQKMSKEGGWSMSLAKLNE